MRHRWRDLARAAGWTWWLAAAALTALRWVDATGIVPALQSGLVLVGLSLVALLLLAVLVRARWLGLAVVALGAVHVALAVPWWVDSSVPPGQDDLVVAAANLEFGQGKLSDLEALVATQDVDVLVLVEATPSTVSALEGSTVAGQLPHRSGRARSDAGGTLLLTREPHERGEAPAGFAFDQVVVSLDVAGEPLTVVGAHPVPPVATRDWRREVAALGDLGGDGALVVTGDLNSSTGHPVLRSLLDRHRLDSAHRVAGQRWVRTWPSEALIPAFVHIDHVLVRGPGIVAAGSWSISGSDHLAVWARLAP